MGSFKKFFIFRRYKTLIKLKKMYRVSGLQYLLRLNQRKDEDKVKIDINPISKLLIFLIILNNINKESIEKI